MKKGDWVIHRRKKDLGIVIAVDSPLYQIRWLGKDYFTTTAISWANMYLIEPAPLDIDEKARDDLFMELALSTKDFQWAAEIHKRMVE